MCVCNLCLLNLECGWGVGALPSLTSLSFFFFYILMEAPVGFWQNLVVKLGLRNLPLTIFLIEGRPLCSSFLTQFLISEILNFADWLASGPPFVICSMESIVCFFTLSKKSLGVESAWEQSYICFLNYIWL